MIAVSAQPSAVSSSTAFDVPNSTAEPRLLPVWPVMSAPFS